MPSKLNNKNISRPRIPPFMTLKSCRPEMGWFRHQSRNRARI